MEGNPFDRTILSILIIFSIYILLKRNIEWRSIFKKNVMIFLWFLFCGISILWSDFAMVSFRRWVKITGLLLSVLIVHTETEPIEAVKIIMKRFAYFLIPISILIIIYFPKIGIEYYTDTEAVNYKGVTYDKNQLAQICAISIIFFIYNIITMRRIKKTPNDKKEILIQVLFLILTIYLFSILDSATSLGALFISIIIFIALGFKVLKKYIKHFEIFIFAALIIGFILQDSFNIIGMFAASQGRNLTFTDRTFIWKSLLSFNINPMIGVGYGSFWLGNRLLTLWGMLGYEPSQSHNGYLNVYLELGVVGLCLLIGVIYFTFLNIKKSSLFDDFDYVRFRMAIFVFALIHNIMESSFGMNTLIWFVFLLIAVDIPHKSQLYNNRKFTTLASSSHGGR